MTTLMSVDLDTARRMLTDSLRRLAIHHGRTVWPVSVDGLAIDATTYRITMLVETGERVYVDIDLTTLRPDCFGRVDH